MLTQIASNISNNSNITVNDPDNSETLNEHENDSFDLNIESIEQFVMLDDNVNIDEINFNSNNSFVDNISNFNIYDSYVPVSIESLVENDNNDNNDNINNISNECVLILVN